MVSNPGDLIGVRRRGCLAFVTATIGSYGKIVKRQLLDFVGSLLYAFTAMAKQPETLDDLIYANGKPIDALAKKAGTSPRAILSLRKGEVETPRVGTVAKLAKALDVAIPRLRKAIQASYDAAQKG